VRSWFPGLWPDQRQALASPPRLLAQLLPSLKWRNVARNERHIEFANYLACQNDGSVVGKVFWFSPLQATRREEQSEKYTAEGSHAVSCRFHVMRAARRICL
jgi:hypothetical protein